MKLTRIGITLVQPSVRRSTVHFGITQGKYNRLLNISAELGKLRKEVWQRYGSRQGISMTERDIYLKFHAEPKWDYIPRKMLQATVESVAQDIKMYLAAAKTKAKKDIWNRTKDEEERKRLFTLLKTDKFTEDSWLQRRMRKHFRHGKTDVANQIALLAANYTVKNDGKRKYLLMQTFERGTRLAIPINFSIPTHISKAGTSKEHYPSIRLILRNDLIEVHYPVDYTDDKPAGDSTIGLDKGYRDAFTDNEGVVYGKALGDLLMEETEYRKNKQTNRNKLRDIAKNASPAKCNRIDRNNLGFLKWNRRQKKHRLRICNIINQACHLIVDKAGTIVVERLNWQGKSTLSRKKNRELSDWTKRELANQLSFVSNRRRAKIVEVNAAYTSRMDSRYGVLLGKRRGRKFIASDGVVLDADQNAAQNVLDRLHDSEIHVYMKSTVVLSVLNKRTEKFLFQKRKSDEKAHRKMRSVASTTLASITGTQLSLVFP